MQFLHKDGNYFYSYDNNMVKFYDSKLDIIKEIQINQFPYSQVYPSKTVSFNNIHYGIHSNPIGSLLFKFNQENINLVTKLHTIDSYDLYNDKLLAFSQGNLIFIDFDGNIENFDVFQDCIVHTYNNTTYLVDFHLNIFKLEAGKIVKILDGLLIQADIVSFEQNSLIVFTYLNSHSILLDFGNGIRKFNGPEVPSPQKCWQYIQFNTLFITKFLKQFFDFEIDNHLLQINQNQ